MTPHYTTSAVPSRGNATPTQPKHAPPATLRTGHNHDPHIDRGRTPVGVDGSAWMVPAWMVPGAGGSSWSPWCRCVVDGGALWRDGRASGVASILGRSGVVWGGVNGRWVDAANSPRHVARGVDAMLANVCSLTVTCSIR